MHGGTTIKVFVKRVGTDYAEVEVPVTASVAGLKDAVISKLKLTDAPDTITLKLEGAAEPLDATMTLEEAGVRARTKLIVQPRAGAAAGA